MTSELNWMQRYAASEVVELGTEGRLSRREMLVRLLAICGSAGAVSAFLAACGDDGQSGSSAGSTASTSPTTEAATTAPSTSEAVTPPTSGGAGHALSVAADDPDIEAENVTFPDRSRRCSGTWRAPPSTGRARGSWSSTRSSG